MKVLIVGYGSIGKRHDKVLSSFPNIESITLVTQQSIEKRTTYRTLQEVKNISQYDYFVIASQTNKHYEHLKYIDKLVKDKIILCEKPLFESKKELQIKNNVVYIGYVLRFHPLLQKLKDFIRNEKVIYANIQCGQYLPTWRPATDYRKSYSSKREEGGGVLLDLSHEIDYVQWLFGKIEEIKSYQGKVSDLEINSDDLTMLIGKTNKQVIINVSLDYISKTTRRKLTVDTLDNSYELDFIKNKLTKKSKNDIEEVCEVKNLERNFMFVQMHQAAFINEDNICTYKEGLKIMDTIDAIQGQNK